MTNREYHTHDRNSLRLVTGSTANFADRRTARVSYEGEARAEGRAGIGWSRDNWRSSWRSGALRVVRARASIE